MSRDAKMRETCLFCKHFYLSFGTEGYSEYTPGTPPEIRCGMGVELLRGWESEEDISEASFAEIISIGVGCEHRIEMD